MSTITQTDRDIMSTMLTFASDKNVAKADVLRILFAKLEEVDLDNDFIVDRIDGAALKDVISKINAL